MTAKAPLMIEARDLKAWLHDGGEIALLDVREHGEYGESHLFYGIPLPYSRLDLDVARLVPRLGTRIVVHDDGASGVAARAAARLAALGYSAVHVLRGGTAGWRDAGFTLFAGVNVPSKAFGEMVEHVFHTPRITAPDLVARQKQGDRLVVVDGRPIDEYRKMAIPGGICCPNGELALRIAAIAPDPATTVVVNCAGRTRSIIGAQTLIDLGIPNPVLALENGTQGWNLADLSLERGAGRLYPAPAGDLDAARGRAASHAARCGVEQITQDRLAAWLGAEDRTTFLCDVRTPEEFAAGSLPGARSTPGGQLLQSTDQYVGVRGARLVVFDNDGIRAPMVAAWLRQMGWEAYVLAEGIDARLPTLPTRAVALPSLPTLDVAALAPLLEAGAASVIDLRPSMAYRAGHLRGAIWSIRSKLGALGLAANRPILLVAEETGVAQLAAIDLRAAGAHDIRVHVGNPAQWRAAGLTLDETPADPPDAACIDFLFFVHDRHSGNKESSRRYLAWELGLIAQLDDQERAAWRFRTAS